MVGEANRIAFTIFLSSPWDMLNERAQVKAVVDELNRLWGRFLAFQIDLLQDATDTFSAVGADGQDVVNYQIGDEYDLYLGLMGSRFGSPTPRAGSGTEEEFNRALARHRKNNGAVRLMFLFRKLTEEELASSEQARKVTDFMARLWQEGMYTQQFSDPQEFGILIRTGITRYMQQWLVAENLITKEVRGAAKASVEEAERTSKYSAAQLKDTIKFLTAAFEEFTHTARNWALLHEQASNRADLEAIFRTGADDLNRLAARMSGVIPDLEGQFADFVELSARVVASFVVPGVFSYANDQSITEKLDSTHGRIDRVVHSLTNLSSALRMRPVWSPEFGRALADCIETVERILIVLRDNRARISDIRVEIASLRGDG